MNKRSAIIVRQRVQKVNALRRRKMTMTCRGLRTRETKPVMPRVTTAPQELSSGATSMWFGSRRLLKLRPWKEGEEIIVAEL